MKAKKIPIASHSRDNIAIKIRRDHHIINADRSHFSKLGRTRFEVLTVVPGIAYKRLINNNQVDTWLE